MDALPTAARPTRLALTAIAGVPVIAPGDDLVALLAAALDAGPLTVTAGDVVVVPSKVISRAEGRFVDLDRVPVDGAAEALAAKVQKDSRLVALVLQESAAVSRAAPGVLITRHRLGHVSANAGIDTSNAHPPGGLRGADERRWALLLPQDPDASAVALRAGLMQRYGVPLGVIITDSMGRPFRMGTVGFALGVAGVPPLVDQRGRGDLFGKPLEFTVTALADQVAAAADLLLGQADEGHAAVVVRGLPLIDEGGAGRALLRPIDQDLYA